MSINFQHLRSFYAIASDRSVSRAARRLNISQPTLSKQLRALEDRHQIKLIEGTRPPLMLTPAGQALYEKAHALFGVASEIDTMLAEATTDAIGTVRLGTDSPPFAAKFMAAFQAVLPHVDFKVSIANARTTNEALVQAQIDMAIVCEPHVHADYIYTPLYRDELVAVLPADWPGLQDAYFPLDALTGATLLIRETTSRTLGATRQLLEDSGVRPARTMEMHTREMIREGIAHGLGISFMFREECPPDTRLRILPIDAESSARFVHGYFAIRAERYRIAGYRKALEVAKELASVRSYGNAVGGEAYQQ